MKFMDPQTFACSACHQVGSYSVASLLAFEAKCPVCGQSHREIGENMHRGIRNTSNFAAALFILFRIEELDRRIGFRDEDFEALETLGDVVAITGQSMTWVQSEQRATAAKELVYAAAKKEFPLLGEPCDELPLHSLFRKATDLVGD